MFGRFASWLKKEDHQEAADWFSVILFYVAIFIFFFGDIENAVFIMVAAVYFKVNALSEE